MPTPLTVPDWPQPSGFSNGMVARGRLVVTAGQIGWNPRTLRIETDDFAAQTAQAMRNVVAVLAVAGAEPSHVVRLTWYITRREEYLAARKAIGAHYREIFGRHFPAMAVVVVAGLVELEAKVEIEATAVIPD